MSTGFPNVPGYRILSRVTDGGSATIFRAERYPRKEICALKVLLPQWVGNKAMEAAFLNEVAVALKMRDKNLIRFNRLVNGAERLTADMEWFPGEPLKAVIAKRGPLPIPEAVEIGKQVAGALAAVHRAGFVHKDLKPDNVLVREGPDTRLIDFSIAQPVKQGLFAKIFGGKARIQGTLTYISPEVLKQEAVDGRCDLWSLGCVLYEALAGKPPFQAVDENALLRRIVAEKHVPVDRVRSDVPGVLARLVDQLLEKDPSRRPADAAAVAASLQGAS